MAIGVAIGTDSSTAIGSTVGTSIIAVIGALVHHAFEVTNKY